MANRMIRITTTALVAAVILAIAGCGGSRVTKANYDKIATGMSKTQVEEILGKTKEQISTDQNVGAITLHGEGMTWRDGKEYIFVTFLNGNVQSKFSSF